MEPGSEKRNTRQRSDLQGEKDIEKIQEGGKGPTEKKRRGETASRCLRGRGNKRVKKNWSETSPGGAETDKKGKLGKARKKHRPGKNDPGKRSFVPELD